MARNSSTTPLAFLGMDRTSGVDRLPPGMMRYAQNCRFTKNGSWQVRKGYRKMYEFPETNGWSFGKIDLSDYQALFMHVGTKIFVTQDMVNFYDIGATRVNEFSAFQEAGQDLFHVSRNDDFLRITTSQTIGDTSSGATELVFEDGDDANFSATGSVRVNGITISYTGVDAGDHKFTGVTGVTADIPAGSLIVQSAELSVLPKGDAIAEFEGATVVGNRPGYPEIIQYSAPATEASPEYAYNFGATGSGAKKNPNSVTALFNSKGALIIGMRNKIDYSSGFTGTDNDVMVTKTMHANDGVPNQNCITDMDGITVLNSSNRVLSVSLSQSGGLQVLDDPLNPDKNLDYFISADLKLADPDQSSSFAHYSSVNRELTLGKTIGGESYLYVYSPDSDTWSIDTGKPYTTMVDFLGYTYALSNFTNKLYRDSYGTNDEGIPIHTVVQTGGNSSSIGLSTTDYTGVVFGGVCSRAAEFRFKIYVDGEEYVNEIITYDQLNEQGFILNEQKNVSIGRRVVGPSPIGPFNTGEDLANFVLPYESLLVGESVEIEWEVFDIDSYVEIRKYAIMSETDDELEFSNFS